MFERKDATLRTNLSIFFHHKSECRYSQEDEGEDEPNSEVEANSMSEFRLVGVGSGNARAGNVDGREREPEAAIGRESCKPSRLETFIFRKNNGEIKNAIDASRERRYPNVPRRV